MKHLFVVRHAIYDNETKGLNLKGWIQAESIAQEISRFTHSDKKSIYLVSSPARRARETMMPIARKFGCDYDVNVRLQPDDFKKLNSQELWGIDNLIFPHLQKDLVIIVSHYEVLDTYPRYVLKNLFKKDEFVKIAERGELWHLNLENGLYEFLPKRIAN